MDPVLAAVVAVLCQYPIAVFSLIKLFGMKKEKNVTVIWNVIIILIPFLGAAAFWIYYLINKKKSAKNENISFERKDENNDENITSAEEVVENSPQGERLSDDEETQS